MYKIAPTNPLKFIKDFIKNGLIKTRVLLNVNVNLEHFSGIP